jgi:glycosyltransferase involved in cell wall biosynthesis
MSTRGASAGRPLRVVHVTHGLQTGGLEKLLVEFARHADRRGVELLFVSLGDRGDLAGDIEAHGWPVVALGQGTGVRPGLVPRLAGLFRSWRADVVHTHNTRGLLYGGPAARLARVPFVLQTYHGRNLVGSPREDLLFRLAARCADRVVCVSEDAARTMAREGVPADKVVTIWNGIDVTQFDYAGARTDGPVVTVARLSPEKDIATLLRAAAIAREEHHGLRLEIAGDGACLPSLQTVTRELGLGEQVRFLGRVRDVPAVLGRASLFVLPSLTEGVSLTLLEAMARGLPVVATRVGGNPEVVVEGETGLLVPPGSPPELARAMLRLQRDPDRSRRMGLAGRKRVERHFDIRRMVADYEALYRRHAGPRGGAESRSALPRVLTNLARLPDNVGPEQGVRPEPVRLRPRPLWHVLRLFLRGFAAEAVLLNQAPYELAMLCALRTLWPFRKPVLASLDLVLARPGPGLRERCKAALKRLLYRQVDLFLCHMHYTPEFRRCYGITPDKVRYVPFKVNYLETVAGLDVPEGTYVFTGGRSRRDYKTFCQAMAQLPYPARMVTPEADLNAAHGTQLADAVPPPNVQVVHDDGSFESWQRELAGARLAVFCITPESISPSGVSAYLVALALKKCVIISECPATRGILEHENQAILVPMRDPDRLRDAIRRAWEDDSYRQAIAERGQRYALSLGGEKTLHRNVTAALLDFLRTRSPSHETGR